MRPSRKSFSKLFSRYVRHINLFCVVLSALISEICSPNPASSLVTIVDNVNTRLRSQTNSPTFTDQNITPTPAPSPMQLISTTTWMAIGDADETDNYVNPNLDNVSTTNFMLGGYTPTTPVVRVSPTIVSDKIHGKFANKQQQQQQQQTLMPEYKFPNQNNKFNNNSLQNNANNTPPPDTPTNPMDADKPDTRLKLAEYIFIQFYEHNVGSLLDANEGQLESNFRTLLGPNPPPAEPLIELAGNASLRLNDSASTLALVDAGYHHGGLLNGTQATSTNSSNATHTVRPYYGDTFHAFTVNYWLINCTTCLVICTVGIFANLMNMVVLTRQNMISPVNTILCAIACSDFIVNLSNIPYLIHELSDNSNISAYYSYGWAFYILMHAHVTVTAHTLSIWLTCALAVWRNAVLRDTPRLPSRNCLNLANGASFTVSKALQAIAVLVISVPIICIPNYLSFAIVEDKADNGTTIYKVGFSGLAENSHHIRIFHFWIFSCLTKLFPCCLLAFFTTLLIKKLLVARERRLRLTAGSNQNRCSSACATLAGGTPIEPARKASTPNGQLFSRDSSKRAGARAQHLESDKRIVANGISNGQAAQQADILDPKRNSDKILVQLPGCQVASTEAPAVSRLVQQVAIGAPHELMHHEDDEFRHGCGGDGGGGGGSGDAEDEHYCAPAQPPASHRHKPLGGNIASGPAAHTRQPGGVCRVHGIRHQLSTTPLSNSSCTTDAECLPTGSNTSSASGNISLSEAIELGNQHHCNHQHRQRLALAQQQLLVETRQDASSPSGQIVCTRAHASGPSAIQTRLADPNEIVGSSKATSGGGDGGGAGGNLAPSCTGRSVSTCGALDLYAINDSNWDGSMCVTAAASLANKQERDEQLDNSATSLIRQNGRPLSFKLKRSGERPVSTTPLVGGDCTAGHNTLLDKKPDPGASETTRGRSVGSATIAPLQIVKFQATHRQLSQNETTTRLLIAVIIVFLICESPAGILAAMCAVFGQEFFENVYQPMGIVTDLLALINSAVNFVLYCFMSTQFRVTFYQVVLRCPAPSPPKGQELTHKQRVAANRR